MRDRAARSRCGAGLRSRSGRRLLRPVSRSPGGSRSTDRGAAVTPATTHPLSSTVASQPAARRASLAPDDDRRQATARRLGPPGALAVTAVTPANGARGRWQRRRRRDDPAQERASVTAVPPSALASPARRARALRASVGRGPHRGGHRAPWTASLGVGSTLSASCSPRDASQALLRPDATSGFGRPGAGPDGIAEDR